MRKLCERPGCSAVAAVSYGMDHAALLVWIDDNARSERELAGRLCRRHADALVVPRGWTIDDRRDPIPRLFRTIAQEVGDGKARPRRSTEPRGHSTRPESPSLFERDDDEVGHVVEVAPEPDREPVDLDVAPELQYEPIDEEPTDFGDPDPDDAVVDDKCLDDEGIPDPDDADPDATQAMPWTPQLTGRYSPDDTGPVSGRLLGRAFGVRKDDE